MQDTPLNPYATPASNPDRVVIRAASVEFLDNARLFAWSRERMKGHFGPAIAQIVLYVVSAIVLSIPAALVPVAGNLASFLLAPIMVGLYASYLRLVREERFEVMDLFSRLRTLLPALAAQILMTLAVLVGLVLLVVPGFILAFDFALTFPLLADEGLGPIEAMGRSRTLMRGHRKQLFFLSLRLLAWGLLCIPTLGLFALWLSPVGMTAYLRFYEQVKAAAPAQD